MEARSIIFLDQFISNVLNEAISNAVVHQARTEVGYLKHSSINSQSPVLDIDPLLVNNDEFSSPTNESNNNLTEDNLLDVIKMFEADLRDDIAQNDYLKNSDSVSLKSDDNLFNDIGKSHQSPAQLTTSEKVEASEKTKLSNKVGEDSLDKNEIASSEDETEQLGGQNNYQSSTETKATNANSDLISIKSSDKDKEISVPNPLEISSPSDELQSPKDSALLSDVNNDLNQNHEINSSANVKTDKLTAENVDINSIDESSSSYFGQYSLLKQREVMSLLSVLTKESFYSVINAGIPVINEEFRNEVFELSELRTEMLDFLMQLHSGSLQDTDDSSVKGLPMEYIPYDSYISEENMISLVATLKKWEKKLKQRVKGLNSKAESLYDIVHGKIARLSGILDSSGEENANAYSSHSKVSILNVIDFIRDPTMAVALHDNYCNHCLKEDGLTTKVLPNPGSPKSPKPSAIVHETTISDENESAIVAYNEQRERKLEKSRLLIEQELSETSAKHFEQFLKVRDNYCESQHVMQSAENMLQQHIQGQLTRMREMFTNLSAIENGDTLEEDLLDVFGVAPMTAKDNLTNSLPVEEKEEVLSDMSDSDIDMDIDIDNDKEIASKQANDKENKRLKSPNLKPTVAPTSRGKGLSKAKSSPYLVKKHYNVEGSDGWAAEHNFSALRENIEQLKTIRKSRSQKEVNKQHQLFDGIELKEPPEREKKLSALQLRTALKQIDPAILARKLKDGDTDDPIISSLMYSGIKPTKLGLTKDIVKLYGFTPRKVMILASMSSDPRAKRRPSSANANANANSRHKSKNGNNEKNAQLNTTIDSMDSEKLLNEIIFGKKSSKPKSPSPKKAPPATSSLLPAVPELRPLTALHSKADARHHSKDSSESPPARRNKLESIQKSELAEAPVKGNLSLAELAEQSVSLAGEQPFLWGGQSIDLDDFKEEEDHHHHHHHHRLPSTDPRKVLGLGLMEERDDHAARLAKLMRRKLSEIDIITALEGFEVFDLDGLKQRIASILQSSGEIVDEDELFENRLLVKQIEASYAKLDLLNRLASPEKAKKDLFVTELTMQSDVDVSMQEFVELVDCLHGTLQGQVVARLKESLVQSHLTQLEAEIEIVEMFLRKCLDHTRLKNLGVLALPSDKKSSSALPSSLGDFNDDVGVLDAISKPPVVIDIDDFIRRGSSLKALENAISNPAVFEPFRVGVDLRNKAHVSNERVLASAAKSLVEQQIEYFLKSLRILLHQQTSIVLNLLEIQFCDYFYPFVVFCLKELQHRISQQRLRERREHIEHDTRSSYRSQEIDSPNNNLPSTSAAADQGHLLEVAMTQRMIDQSLQFLPDPLRKIVCSKSILSCSYHDFHVNKIKLKTALIDRCGHKLTKKAESNIVEAKKTSKLLL